jgi:hypothetical protein
MTLTQWVDEEKRLLTEFEHHWRRSNKEDPEAYPDDLDTGEWLEQFMFWTEAQRKISELENTP